MDVAGATLTVSHLPAPAQASGIPLNSVLFDRSHIRQEVEEQPAFFPDLNLDQIVAGITAGREEYSLKPFFHSPLNDVDAVGYRHEVFHDLANDAISAAVHSFGQEMKTMRSYLAQAGELHYERQKQSWFLDAVSLYCTAVRRLRSDLERTPPCSRGLRRVREYLSSYLASPEFSLLDTETTSLSEELYRIRYFLHIDGKRITVRKYDPRPDYSIDVLQTFRKFEAGEAKDYHFTFRSWQDMSHVEAAILDRVALLHQETFSTLDRYCSEHREYLDTTIALFDREVQFYLACIDFTEPLKRAGLPFCYPVVTDTSKEVFGAEVYDLALAARLIAEKTAVVTNDFHLQDPERIFVVSGPNQGGKTTFARTFGQLHYLARVGCPVPAARARLFLFDKLFTHFEREEMVQNLRGKLEDELLRIHDIFQRATPHSILIMNESFLSTTVSDALSLSRKIMRRIIELDMLCVSVTFLDEITSLSATTVSMVSTVDPGDPARRTYKLIRKPADGRAYAITIAEKYGLTYGTIRERLAAPPLTV